MLHRPAMSLIVRRRDQSASEIITPITVEGILQPGSELRCDALVDTGAHCLTLPLAWRSRFGSMSVSHMVEVEVADGRIVSGELCGPLKIQIADFPPVVGEAVFIEMPDEGPECQP